MEKIESPNKLRINYKLFSKTRKIELENPSEKPELSSFLRRSSLTPSKSKPFNISSKLAKLQEELDSAELSLKLSKHNPSTSNQQIYKSYLDNLIQTIIQQDRTTGMSLQRGWTGFLYALKQEPPAQVVIQLPNNQISKETLPVSTQVTEELLLIDQTVDYDSYIDALLSMNKNLNTLQIGSIVEKLKQLNAHLQPMEIPPLSQIPELKDIDLIDTVKVIHTKLKARFIQPSPPTPPPPLVYRSSESQTFLSIEDFETFDSYKSTIERKEVLICELTARLKRNAEVEEVLKQRNKENEELRQKVQDVLNEGCGFCKVKREQLANTSSQIRQLQMTVSKGLGTERELEITKKKLNESLNVISLNNTKILTLSSNLQDLNEKVEETKAQRELLMKKLQEEEKMRGEVELQLQKEVETNVKLQKVIQKYVPDKKNTIFESALIRPDSRYTNLETLSSNTLTPSQIVSKTSQFTQNFSVKSTLRVPQTIQSSFTPEQKKPNIRNQFLDGLSQFSETPSSSKKVQKTQRKKEKVMNILGMTKQEYLSLSKKDRLELFECLYEHKEKCGADCEHLKRAMKIRFKDKNPLFPLKKFNIS